MNQVKIITDSCSDLTPELFEKYGIDYAKMNTVIEGKEIPASLYWEYFSPKEFYDILRSGKKVTTTQVPVEEFERVFVEWLDKKYDLVYIGCSSKLSGSVNTASVVAKELAPKYPDAKIVVIDSKIASMGEGMLAIEAAKLAAAGKNADEIEREITALRLRARQGASVDSLTFLARAGRIKATKAFFGNLLGVKPLVVSDYNGDNVACGKTKGRKNSFRMVLDYAKEHIRDAQNQTVYFGHADCPQEEIDEFRAAVETELKPKDFYVYSLGPIIGTSTGPGMYGFYFFGDEKQPDRN